MSKNDMPLSEHASVLERHISALNSHRITLAAHSRAMEMLSANPPPPWNPTTEPAISVKAVLVGLHPVLQVLRDRTIGELGLEPLQVQTRMNARFFPEDNPRLTVNECGLDRTPGDITLRVSDLQNP